MLWAMAPPQCGRAVRASPWSLSAGARLGPRKLPTISRYGTRTAFSSVATSRSSIISAYRLQALNRDRSAGGPPAQEGLELWIVAQGAEGGEGEPARLDPFLQGALSIDEGGRPVADESVDQRGGVDDLGVVEALLQGALRHCDGLAGPAQMGQALGFDHAVRGRKARRRLSRLQSLQHLVVERPGLVLTAERELSVGQVESHSHVAGSQSQSLPVGGHGFFVTSEQGTGEAEVRIVGALGLEMDQVQVEPLGAGRIAHQQLQVAQLVEPPDVVRAAREQLFQMVPCCCDTAGLDLQVRQP